MAMGTQIRMYEKRGDSYPRCRVELPIVSLSAVIEFALYGSISMITEDRFEVYDSSSSSYLLFDLEGNIIN